MDISELVLQLPIDLRNYLYSYVGYPQTNIQKVFNSNYGNDISFGYGKRYYKSIINKYVIGQWVLYYNNLEPQSYYKSSYTRNGNKRLKIETRLVYDISIT